MLNKHAVYITQAASPTDHCAYFASLRPDCSGFAEVISFMNASLFYASRALASPTTVAPFIVFTPAALLPSSPFSVSSFSVSYSIR